MELLESFLKDSKRFSFHPLPESCSSSWNGFEGFIAYSYGQIKQDNYTEMVKSIVLHWVIGNCFNKVTGLVALFKTNNFCMKNQSHNLNIHSTIQCILGRSNLPSQL